MIHLIQIYNEEIRDLLGKDIKAKLEVKEHPEKGVYVAGAKNERSVVNSLFQEIFLKVYQCMQFTM